METQGKDVTTRIIYVSPVPRTSVQGWDKVNYVIYKKGSNEIVSSSRGGATKAFGRDGAAHETFMFPIDYTSMKVVTGMDEMMDNPLFKLDVKEIRAAYNVVTSHWSDELLEKLSESPRISKQTFFEIKHNTRPGYYTDEVKGGTIFDTRDLEMVKNNPDYAPSFLQKFKFTFYDRANRITDETPRGTLAQLLTEIHPAIANSKSEINTAVHRWYISEENEAEMERVKKQDIIHEAIAKLVELKNEHSELTQLKVANVLTNHNNRALVAGEVGKSTLIDRLNGYVSRTDKYQMENIGKFQKIMDLLKNKEGKIRLEIKYLIALALHNNIMSLRDGW